MAKAEKKVDAEVVKEEEVITAEEPKVEEKPKAAKKADPVMEAGKAVKTVRKPGDETPKIKAAIRFVAQHAMTPETFADFKQFYPEIFED